MIRWAVRSLSICIVLAAGVASARPAGSLLDRLPGPATIAFGMNRVGSETDLASVLQSTFAPLLGKEVQVPPCVFGLFVKVEAIAGTLDTSAAGLPRAAVAVRGAGLRPALEACARQHAAGLTVTQEGAVTRYQLDKDSAYVVWLDDATLVVGPATDAAATAALARTAAQPRAASRDPRLRALLARVDTGSPLWAVVDGAALTRLWPDDLPHPRQAWAALARLDLAVTLAMASPAAAAALAARLRGLVEQAKNPAAASLAVATDGARAMVTVPVGKLLAQRTGADPASVRPTAVALATVGIVAAVAIPAFVKATRQARGR